MVGPEKGVGEVEVGLGEVVGVGEVDGGMGDVLGVGEERGEDRGVVGVGEARGEEVLGLSAVYLEMVLGVVKGDCALGGSEIVIDREPL
jgi:hypothetical protein